MTTANLSRPTSYMPITISDGIRTSMGRDPDKIAFRESGRELTYRTLVERIDRVANGVTHGIQLEPGTVRHSSRPTHSNSWKSSAVSPKRGFPRH